MSEQDRFTLIQDTAQAFGPHYAEAVRPGFGEGGMQGGDWGRLFFAYGLDPEPVTVAFAHSLNPYGNIENPRKAFAETAYRGFLEVVGTDTYQLTERGRSAMNRFFESAGAALAPIEPLPAADLDRIAAWLRRIIEATAAAPEPAAKQRFNMSRRTDPGPDAPAIVRIDQYLTDLVNLRDDAHLAAWAGHNVSGHVWETLTAIWRDEADTPAALADMLKQRGYSEEAYAAALRECAQKGWLEEVDKRYRITEAGKQLREAAEAGTDRFFFTGWSVLSGAEAAELTQQLARLRQRLLDMAADQIVAARRDLEPLTGNVSQAIFTLTRPTVNALTEEADIAERGLLASLLAALSLEPQPTSGEQIARRHPYGTSAQWNQFLATLAGKGLLANGNDTYRLTQNGRATLSRLLAAFYQRLGEIESTLSDQLPAADLNRLVELLGRIADACLNAPEPPGHEFASRSHNLASKTDVPALAKIDQALDDLNAFREDAHIASFRPHNISGHAWELFTFLWRGEVKNAAEMAEKAAFRGHSVEAYAEALKDLIGRGWVEQTGEDVFGVTEAGRPLRQEAETQTDRYYYAPWATLNTDETGELRDLLTRLEVSLKHMAEPVPA